MVAEAADATEFVLTVKVALLLPAAIITALATLAEGLSLESAMDTPSAGAGPLKLTVPVTDVPPVTPAGLSESDESAMPSVDVSDRVTVDLAVIETSSWICPP